MNRRNNRAGFTLVELMLAMSISIMVFAAMGLLLNKSFSLWKQSTGHWRLTQYARLSRERILCGITNFPAGGVTNLPGLLAASNLLIKVDSGWTVIEYCHIAESGTVYQIRGWPGEASDKDLQIRRGSSAWAYGLSKGATAPDVKVDMFSATETNHVVSIIYRLRLSAVGKTPLYQWQTITTSLLNED